MDSRYKEFLERNPTFQNRIEAFTSGILSPDTKAIALWAMEPEEFYTQGELHARVKEFSGGNFPITHGPTFSYCNGLSGKFEGSLYSIGAVIKDKFEIIDADIGSLMNVSYAKSNAGEDFGDALAARALTLSQRLNSKYKSMLRIFGAANKPKNVQLRRGFAVYKIIKHLAENKDKEYRAVDLEEILGLSQKILSNTLNSLGNAGIIYYSSRNKDIKGKRARGWAVSHLTNHELLRKSLDEVYREIKSVKLDFDRFSYLGKIVEYIKAQPDENYENNELGDKLKIKKNKVSGILSLLRKLNYLKAEFVGGNKLSITKANNNTILTWNLLLQPIEAIADRVDAKDCREFYDELEKYNSDNNLRLKAVKNQLWNIYENERTSRGIQGSEEIDAGLFSLPQRVMKLSEIKEYIEKRLGRRLSYSSIDRHLKIAVKQKAFEKVERGRYQKIV